MKNTWRKGLIAASIDNNFTDNTIFPPILSSEEIP